MKAFTYNGELYIRVIPGKKLFNSTMVHEVVNRGDIFAMRVSDQQLTVVPGKAEVAHTTLSWQQRIEPAANVPFFLAKHCLEVLKDKINPPMYQEGDSVQVYLEGDWVQNCTVTRGSSNTPGYVDIDMPGHGVVCVHVLNIKRLSP